MRNVSEVDLGEPFEGNREHYFQMRSFSPPASPPLSPLAMSHHLSPIQSPSYFHSPLPLVSRPYALLLPIEIYLYIFEHFSNEELLTIALVSRYFETLCLETVCRRMHFVQGDDLMLSGSHDRDSIILLRSVCRLNWPIPRFTFTFPYSISDCRFPEEIVFIRRVITHLQRQPTPHPSEIALDFCQTGTSLLFGRHGRKRAYRRWAKPLRDLFDYIILFTGTLTVRCGKPKHPIRKSDINHAAKQLGLTEEVEPPAPSLDLLGQIRSSLMQCLPHVFGFTSAYCAKDSLEMQELPFYTTSDLRRRADMTRPALPSPGLSGLNIHSPILFHPALLRWTLELFWTRCTGLSHLSFHCPDVARSCWDVLLSHIRAPQIHSLDFDDCTFSLAEISPFIAQHTQLHTLTLGPNLAESPSPGNDEHHPPWLPLQDVTSIIAVPSYFTRLLFGPTLVAPRLQYATFLLRTVKEDSIADMDNTLSFIYNRLSSVRLTLQLTMTTGSAQWFHSQTQHASVLGVQRIPIRHLISSLRICADIYTLKAELWNHLPRWISTFLPNVTSVYIVERSAYSNHECGGNVMALDIRSSREIREFVGSMRLYCRDVTELQVGDVSYQLEA